MLFTHKIKSNNEEGKAVTLFFVEDDESQTMSVSLFSKDGQHQDIVLPLSEFLKFVEMVHNAHSQRG